MLPMFKKSHINTRSIEDYINRGVLKNYSDDSNKKNALKQASLLYKMVDGDLYRHGSDREYGKYGLRVVVHDDEPQRKLDIISKCHMDEMGNHYGMNNTIKNVNKLYYWHGLSSHVKMFLKKCEHCKERSKFSMEEWLEEEKRNLSKKRMMGMEQMSTEVQKEIKGLGRIKKATPPETFFIVNAQRKVALDSLSEDPEMLIDSNNIEFVVETLGNNEDGQELKEVCHVLNVPDIVPMPERFRSREIENFLKYGSYPSDFTQNQKSGLKGPAVQYCIVDDELYHNPSKKKADGGLRLVVHDDTPALKVKVMVESHLDEDGNHLGLNRTMQKINEKYFWLGLSLDVRKFMAKCKICAHNRGRRLDEDTSRFTEEVKKLKERQISQESGTSMEEVFATTFTLNDEVGQTENYDQVYRLMGNNENDITEITVKVVNGEIIQTVQENNPEAFQLGEAELVPIGTNNEETVKDQEGYVEINEISATQSSNEACETVSEKEPVKQDAAHPETFIVAGAVDQSTEVQTTKEKDTDGNENNSSKTTDTNVSVETAIEMLVDNEGCGPTEAAEQANPQQSPSQTTELPHLYEQCVYLPKSKRTRAIEQYLLDRTVTMGYTSFKLRELAENFMVEDDIMYRRASRYKGKQIVIHDDQPEVKFKILTDYHRKPNGDHCSEMVTFTNIQYKFFWEELRWDVNRFYKLCHTCVEDGIEIKTKKRVLSVEELKMKEYQQRKKQTESGSNAKRNKAFRLANKGKLDTFKSWEKYGKDVDEVLPDGSMVWNLSLEHEEEVEDGEACPDQKESPIAEEESDIEINLDEGSDTETPCDEMVTLTVYATQEQEGKIRELFQQSGWEYKLSSMKRCPTETSEPGPEDLYEMMMMTTSDQDQAIQELFKSSEVEQEQRPTPDEVKAQELEEKPISKPSQTKASNKTPVKEQVKKEDQKLLKKATLKEKETIKEEKLDHDQNPTPDVVIEEQSEKTSTNKVSKMKVPKKTPVKERIKKEDLQKPIKQEKTKAGTPKRTATDLNEPNSESRRPRREIKRPRRFSPDRMDEQKNMSPKKTPKLTEKSKSESPMVESNKRSQKTEDPDVSSPQGRGLIKKGDNSGPKSTPKSDKTKPLVKKTPGKSTETPSRATRYSSRTQNTPTTEVITDKPGQKRKLHQGDSIVAKDIKSSKVKLKVEDEDAKIVKEDTKEMVPNEQKKADVTNVAGDIAPNVSNESDKTKGNRPEVASKNIERFDNDDEDYDDDDTFFDDEDFDEDDERSVENTALEVLKVDTGFEMEAISIDGLYMCSLCDAEFVNEDDCKIHGLQNKCFIDCKLCGRMFRKNEKVELEKHRALHGESNTFPCSYCEKVFTDSKCQGIHMRAHTGKEEELCRVCGASFHTSFLLASHMYRIHGESNMFKCDICKAKFVNINFMKSEILFDGVLSYFQCVMCNK